MSEKPLNPENKSRRSLDIQIKEAELRKLESEISKNEAEKELALKQVNQKWYSGSSIKLIVGGVLTAISVLSVFYVWIVKPLASRDSEISKRERQIAALDTEIAKKQVEKLNREKAKIDAEIDSLNLRLEITAAWGKIPDSHYDNSRELFTMIREKGYYDKIVNPNAKGFTNDFKTLSDNLVLDKASNLTWQRAGSIKLTYRFASAYVDSLNRMNYEGFSDWRLPNLDEAMTLMEPNKVGGLYIEPLFDRNQKRIWASDNYSVSRGSPAWYVDFLEGYCLDFLLIDDHCFVRAVR